MGLISFYVSKKIAKTKLIQNWHSLIAVMDKLYDIKWKTQAKSDKNRKLNFQISRNLQTSL